MVGIASTGETTKMKGCDETFIPFESTTDATTEKVPAPVGEHGRVNESAL
jgi:hypothetical protein